MNKQQTKNGRGIEWTNYTWNPVGGCQHGCRWTMPDGAVAECYAETVAENVAQSAYPHGFEHHYWNEKALQQPLNIWRPSKIFLNSMSDLMGAWVPDEQIKTVFDICRKAHWHSFQLLTKNAPRLLKFNIPSNVWVGVSAPPTTMFGKELSPKSQAAMVRRSLSVLAEVQVPVRWMSIEPLSFDIAPLLEGAKLEWAVIGAATNGRKVYQPKPEWVTGAVSQLRKMNASVFFKGNIRGNAGTVEWLEEFPKYN